MVRKKQYSIEKLIYEGILSKDGIPVQPTKQDSEQLHLNISKAIKFDIRKLKFPNVPTPLKAMVEIVQNVFTLGIAGGFSAFLLLFLLPFDLGIPLVGLVKSNLWLEVIVVVMGSGSMLYIFYDIVDLFKKEKVGK
jgi:hypothetical protein